jgi:DNA-binding response OmpR family regulator
MQGDKPTDTAILVMERTDADLKLIRSTLQKVGFEVVNPETGSDVPRLLAAEEESLRLVVADPATPGLDFRELLKKLHDADSPARVLCLCEEPFDVALPASYKQHIGARLRRPFRRSRLVASILDATSKPLARTA